MRLLGVTSLDELTPQHVTQLYRLGRGASGSGELVTSVTLFPQVTAHNRRSRVRAESQSLANRDVATLC